MNEVNTRVADVRVWMRLKNLDNARVVVVRLKRDKCVRYKGDAGRVKRAGEFFKETLYLN
jgi:hypothetical protein